MNFSSRPSAFRTFQSSTNESFGSQHSHMSNIFNDNSPRNPIDSNHFRNNTFENQRIFRDNTSVNGFGFSKQRNSNLVLDGSFGNEPLQMGDFMDDFEIDRRFPKDKDNHFIHHLTEDNNMNGMSHHIIDDEDKENDLKCLICLAEFNVNEKAYKLRCSHIFHEDCLVPWRNKHNTCPTCRKIIDSRSPPEISQTCVIC